ncbi:MAG: hypothetical protein M1826_004794 [Phylliscum demangeonii]|nr:MAG: hypothetical protein M1826_004794 [Phylliscum demangeonii]
MGLPVFIEPASDTESKSPPQPSNASKAADPTVLLPSTVRRRSQTRRGPDTRPPIAFAEYGRDHGFAVEYYDDVLPRPVITTTTTVPPLAVSPFTMHSQLSGASAHVEGLRYTAPPSHGADVGPISINAADLPSLNATAAEQARTEMANRQRLENGRALLRDALSFERPGPRLRAARDPGRDSFLDTVDEPPPPAPRAPARREDDEFVTLRAPAGAPAYTPRFAPAYRLGSPVLTSRRRTSTGPDRRRIRFEHRRQQLRHRRRQLRDLDARNDHDEDMLLLDEIEEAVDSHGERLERRRLRLDRHLARHREDRRRVAGAAAHPAPRAASSLRPTHTGASAARPIDGLGDRRRSLSPDEETWETLRTTITPDQQLPSTESSFTSATASSRPSRSSLSRTGSGLASASTSITAPDPERVDARARAADEREADRAFALNLARMWWREQDQHELAAGGHGPGGLALGAGVDDDLEHSDASLTETDDSDDDLDTEDAMFRALDAYHRHQEGWDRDLDLDGDLDADADDANGRPSRRDRAATPPWDPLAGITRGSTAPSSSWDDRTTPSAPPPADAADLSFLTSGLSPGRIGFVLDQMVDYMVRGGHLDLLRRILRALAERDDVPADWWASAGVLRALPLRSAISSRATDPQLQLQQQQQPQPQPEQHAPVAARE